MRHKAFKLESVEGMDFHITHAVLDQRSPLNQNDAHIHEECEVYINLSGNVAFAVEERVYPVRRGSVIVTMPYEYHHCVYRSDAPHEHYWITFSAARGSSFLKLFFDRQKGMDNRIVLGEAELEAMCSLLEQLLTERVDELERRILVLRFFQLLKKGAVDAQTENTDPLPPDVAAALSYMDTHLREELDVRMLANAGCVSVNTLERHFKERLGETPIAVLRKKRLFASMMYLRNGATVTQAAEQSGFSDYANYIQLFRRQFGMTPGRYRKLNIAFQ